MDERTDYLKKNRDRIRVVPERDGAWLQTDDFDLWDALDDYLSENGANGNAVDPTDSLTYDFGERTANPQTEKRRIFVPKRTLARLDGALRAIGIVIPAKR